MRKDKVNFRRKLLMEQYSISDISKMFNLPISTLRYYDSEGLFPDIERKNNIRIFSSV